MAEEKSLIQRQPNAAKDPAVFDVEQAYETGEVAGTFISDRKKKGVFGQLKEAASEIAGSATKAVQKEAEILIKKPEKPQVVPGVERKDVVEKAVRAQEQAPRDDHDVVIERIRTFQKDAERVSGKPYLIKKNKDQVSSSWSHVLGDKPKQETPLESEPAKVAETIRRTPKPQMPQQMQRTVISTPTAPKPQPKPAAVEQTPPPAPKPPVPERRPQPTPKIEPSRLEQSRKFIGIGISVLVAGVVLVGGIYLYNTLTIQTETIAETPTTLDFNEYLPIEQIATLPIRLENQETTLSAITIVAREGDTAALDTASFLTAVADSVPGLLTRALGDAMAVGGVRTNSGAYPYLLFRTINFDNAFSAMLAWEKTLATDLNELFGGARPTTFVDRVIANQHVRVLYDDAGSEQIVYGFINGRSLIITATTAGFREVLSGL